jgi:hypothetical protein
MLCRRKQLQHDIGKVAGVVLVCEDLGPFIASTEFYHKYYRCDSRQP